MDSTAKACFEALFLFGLYKLLRLLALLKPITKKYRYMVESVENTPYGREMIIEAVWLKDQVPVVRKVDNAIHRINHALSSG